MGTSKNLEVALFPETQESRGRAWVKDILLIGFVNESFSEPDLAPKLSLAKVPLRTTSTKTFELILHVKRLRTYEGAYEILYAIREALHGARISPFTGPLYVTEVSFTELKDSRFWLWSITCKLDQNFVAGDCC